MKRMVKVRRLFAGPVAAIAVMVALAGLQAASDTLPGGSAISVQILSPANGAVVPEGPVAVSGTASVGEGVPVPNTLLVYVIDLSGSTVNPVAGTLCGNQNADGEVNRIIDCEIAAAKALNNAAVAAGTVFEIGAVGFGGVGIPNGTPQSAFALDLSPASGVQTLIEPDADANTNAQRDLDEVLFRVFDQGLIQIFTGASVGASTNYYHAVLRAVEIANASSAPNKIVVFLSDGFSQAGGPAGQPVSFALATVPDGITFHSFAIGNDAACTPPAGVSHRGTLQEIADATGGTCTDLANPEDIVGVLPAVIGSTLTGVSVSVDGGAPGNAPTTPLTPVTGPASTTWEFTTGALAPGSREICATAGGTDGGGDGSVTECITVHVNAAPIVTAGGGAGAEGSPIPVAAAITDDGTPSVSWSYTAGAGVDPGATCTFADPSAATTTIQCTDDGSFTVTATVNDGINPAVEASASVAVSNADPAVAITSPAAGANFAVGAPVALATVTGDPGANDTVACTINWGDGNTEAGCGGTHAYAAGTYTIVVTASDGDGGTHTATVTIQVNAAPTCGGVSASPGALWPPNNKFVLVTLSGGSDPDGDAITLAVTGVTQDEAASAGGDASLAGGNQVNLRASRLGSGDGRIYEVAYTITDAHGATCSGTTTVGVPHDSSGGAAVDSVVRFPSIP